jgi:hypothetical protein
MTKKGGRNVWGGGGYIGLSIALGAAFGVAFDNIPMGAVVGLLIGVILAAWARYRPD